MHSCCRCARCCCHRHRLVRRTVSFFVFLFGHVWSNESQQSSESNNGWSHCDRIQSRIFWIRMARVSSQHLCVKIEYIHTGGVGRRAPEVTRAKMRILCRRKICLGFTNQNSACQPTRPHRPIFFLGAPVVRFDKS